MKRRAAIAAIAGAAASLTGCGDSKRVDTRPRWPVLPLSDLGGRAVTLPPSAAVRVINLWALWCPPCRYELPGLERLAFALAPRGIEVCAIALAEESFAVREYVAQHASALRNVILSPDAPHVKQLGLDALPQTFFVSADSAVLGCWVGARDWDSPQVRGQLELLLQSA